MAVEFALILPIMLFLTGGGLDLWQLATLNSTAQFVAQAASTRGAAALRSGGDPIAAAQFIIDANAGLWVAGATFTPVITSDGTTVTVTISASAEALFPLPAFQSMSANSAATS